MGEQTPSNSATVFATTLGSHGLDPTGSVFWNLTGKELRDIAVESGEATRTADGALLATTGNRTGRSPNDRFIVNEPGLASSVHWSKVNRPISPAVFDHLLKSTQKHLNSATTLFVKDMHCGADPAHTMPVRLVSESAWHSAFMHNMFIRSHRDSLSTHVPEFTILHAPTMTVDPKEYGVNSEVFVVISLSRGIVLIGGTRYAGEIKKSIFTIMNHILPSRGLLPMHCSANTSGDESALFFGLSGTGKTTLSADPGRELVGDDEHGWSDQGIFNFEGGCYAKMIGLSEEDEPAIYATTKMESTILENVILDADGIPNFHDSTLTQNTRASYPIDSIENRTEDSTAGHPKNVVFLTCDAFGVLPPISRLSPAQAAYHFISGYTAKVAGTEVGVTEPMATFSACFGAPFMPRHPSEYANLLSKKIADHDASCWLINTGWIAGGYGESSRIRINWTRALLNAALSGDLDDVVYVTDERFGFKIPVTCDGVPSEILQPRSTWSDVKRYDNVANVLVQMFNENFESFADGCSDEVKAAAPRIHENQASE
ncbi:MAG: phosphoenolpyruvate carboxykinase (ATP) [Candidatus Thermoplasmatota archaeon]|jgi:phosphoenolpyruvate carboxykinase (ATP)|nr:phosphoenolpyruvate carboxykinase (ATP) [Candidatus Thermoplasmatota archaeon]GIR80741.1 MAG: phosphoenolpyruvate carboxykinase [ATP] [Euryarchaeota archaeon]|tara:strand:+ start:1393 stop:3024 length:1632 start_codon:yes stop_codon:yes gene_type:complete